MDFHEPVRLIDDGEHREGEAPAEPQTGERVTFHAAPQERRPPVIDRLIIGDEAAFKIGLSSRSSEFIHPASDNASHRGDEFFLRY